MYLNQGEFILIIGIANILKTSLSNIILILCNGTLSYNQNRLASSHLIPSCNPRHIQVSLTLESSNVISLRIRSEHRTKPGAFFISFKWQNQLFKYMYLIFH